MKYLNAFLFLLACIVFSGKAMACSCAGPMSPVNEFSEAKAVFSSHIGAFRKDENGNPMEIVLQIDKIWKGELPDTYTIDVSQLRSGCAFWGFQENTDYLIYAHKSWNEKEPDRLEISMCSRTKRLDQAQIETRYLDAILSNADTGVIDRSLPDILTSEEPANMRVEAARLLGWMILQNPENPPEGTIPAFLEAARSDEEDVKLAVAQNLGKHSFRGQPGVTEALLGLLKDESEDIRNSAASSLAMVGQGEAHVFKALVHSLKQAQEAPERDDKRHEVTLTVLGRSIAGVARTEGERAEAVKVLDNLIDKIKDPYNKVTLIQQLGFQKVRARNSAQNLIDTLKAADHYHLKQYTIHALGDIQATEALTEIKRHINDDNCYVVKSTFEAVHKISPESFSSYFREEAMPVIKDRYDACDHQMIWGLKAIGEGAKEMKPFLEEKYRAMSEDDWKRNQLKELLEKL